MGAPSILQATVEDIRTMRVRGAAPLAVAAAKALGTHVSEASGDLAAVREAARAGARLLDASRPTAVSLRHATGYVLSAVERASDVAEARQAGLDAGRRFAADVKASEQAIASHGAAAIPKGERILTHCHSSTVVAILAKAHEEGKGIEVFATETRPFRQGLTTVRWLREAEVPVTLIVDSAVLHTLRSRKVGRVLVGADTVASDGSLFNKIGTSQAALAAKSTQVPFWVAASWIKFTPQPADGIVVEEREHAEVVAAKDLAAGARVHNPVFDRTPAEDIAGFVTEDGPKPPAQAVRAALQRMPRRVA